MAIYGFARTADDIADEGDAPPQKRIADLHAFRAELEATAHGRTPGPRWPHVFVPLRAAMQRHALPAHLLNDLLSAFIQDATNPLYEARTDLLDYCSRSANPVGRLLLHLYKIDDDRSVEQADAICSALQLINFWQDLSVDLPRGRCYLTLSDLRHHDLTLQQLQTRSENVVEATRGLVAELCVWSRELMLDGAPLAHRIPGRAGWELRLVVQGGLRILDKIAAMRHRTLAARPKLSALDAPLLLLRAVSRSG